MDVSERSGLPRWCPYCPTNGYHAPENCPDRGRREAGKAESPDHPRGAVDPSEVEELREQLATARQVADDGWAWVEKALNALGVETVFEIPDHPRGAIDP